MSAVWPVVVAVLAGALALNLALTLRLAKVVAALEEARVPHALPLGAVLPAVAGHRLVDGRPVDTRNLEGTASVLVFFSPGCPVCRGKLPELEGLVPAMREAGVALWVVVAGRAARGRDFLGTSPLAEHAVVLKTAALAALNPRHTSPFYVFADQQRRVQASHLIGDENWNSFLAQMGAPRAAA